MATGAAVASVAIGVAVAIGAAVMEVAIGDTRSVAEFHVGSPDPFSS